MAVDIQASFSAKDKPRNGLEAIIDELVSDGLQPRYIIAEIVSPTHKVNNEDGSKTPAIKIVGIEPALLAADIADVKTLYERLCKARTGNPPNTALPLSKADGEQELPLDDGEERDPTAGPWPGDPGFSHPPR